ncbi:G-PROTEIN-RECEP-F1-2 domain-containing protein [Aphelenchoides fujianensis]|nr:G-PROTEIN-RECEP-F1-2 domain-containing protein [Aphelenchoides fujianensis]
MSGLLNGPVTLTIVSLGSVFNALTICVLFTKKIQRYRQSVYNSPQTRKFSNTIHNDRCSTEATNNPLASTRKRPTRSSGSRPRVYTFFVWLAVSDTSLLLCALLLYSLPNLVSDLGPYVHFFPLFYYLSNTALTSSVWLISALMLDRYRSLVVNKFSVRSNTPAVNRLLLGVVALAFVFNLPRFFEIGTRFDEVAQRTVIFQTTLVESSAYMIGYRIAGGLMFYSLLPYIFLFVLGFKVAMVIRAAALQRQKMNAYSASGSFFHTCTTDSEMILGAVVAKFLLSRLLPTTLDVSEHIVGSRDFTRSTLATFCVDISNLVVVTSSAINLFIFYFCSASFRKSLHALLDRKTRARSPLSHHVSVVSLTPVQHKKSAASRLPRQLSLQVESARRPSPLNRKATVAGLSLAVGGNESTSPLASDVSFEVCEVQRLTVIPAQDQDAISLP